MKRLALLSVLLLACDAATPSGLVEDPAKGSVGTVPFGGPEMNTADTIHYTGTDPNSPQVPQFCHSQNNCRREPSNFNLKWTGTNSVQFRWWKTGDDGRTGERPVTAWQIGVGRDLGPDNRITLDQSSPSTLDYTWTVPDTMDLGATWATVRAVTDQTTAWLCEGSRCRGGSSNPGPIRLAQDLPGGYLVPLSYQHAGCSTTFFGTPCMNQTDSADFSITLSTGPGTDTVTVTWRNSSGGARINHWNWTVHENGQAAWREAGLITSNASSLKWFPQASDTGTFVFHIAPGNDCCGDKSYKLGDWERVPGTVTVPVTGAVTTPVVAPTITASAPDVDEGGTTQVTVTPSGGTYDRIVYTYSVTSGPGSVNSTGLYTAPADVTSNQSVTVRVGGTAHGDGTNAVSGGSATVASADATFNVRDVPAVTTPVVAPTVTLASIGAVDEGGTVQMVPTATGGTYDRIVYSYLIAVGPGSVSNTGLYTAPADVTGNQRVTLGVYADAHGDGVNAISGDTARSNTAAEIVTIRDTSTATLPDADAPSFTINVRDVDEGRAMRASVSYSGGTYDAVSAAYSVTSGPGTINSSSGVYSAPADVTANTTVQIGVLIEASGTGTIAKTGTTDQPARKLASFTVRDVPTLTTRAPHKPRVEAHAGTSSIQVGWSYDPETHTYSVSGSNRQSSGYSTLASGLTGRSYTETGLSAGTTRCYRVTASNTVGSATSAAVCQTIPDGTGPVDTSTCSGVNRALRAGQSVVYNGQCHSKEWAYYTLDGGSSGPAASDGVTVPGGSTWYVICGNDGDFAMVRDTSIKSYCGDFGGRKEGTNYEWVRISW